MLHNTNNMRNQIHVHTISLELIIILYNSLKFDNIFMISGPNIMS